MADKNENVKERVGRWARCLDFMDRHPRTGWFLCALALLNTIINVITLYVVV